VSRFLLQLCLLFTKHCSTYLCVHLLHNLLDVLIQIANKIGFKKKGNLLLGYLTVQTCIEYRSPRQLKNNIAVVFYSKCENPRGECFTEFL
jgi:hypothetical protein